MIFLKFLNNIFLIKKILWSKYKKDKWIFFLKQKGTLYDGGFSVDFYLFINKN